MRKLHLKWAAMLLGTTFGFLLPGAIGLGIGTGLTNGCDAAHSSVADMAVNLTADQTESQSGGGTQTQTQSQHTSFNN